MTCTIKYVTFLLTVMALGRLKMAAILVKQSTDPFQELNLPAYQIPIHLFSQKALRMSCQQNATCPYKEHIQKGICWGYEANCDVKKRFGVPDCSQIAAMKHQPRDIEFQKETYYRQADFGWLLWERESMQMLCEPDHEISTTGSRDDSTLVCTANMRFCHATNLYIDFSGLLNPPPDAGKEYFFRHRPDLWKKGQIGGKCKVDQQLLKKQNKHVATRAILRTWYEELEHYATLENKQCDEVIEEPVIFQKLDVGVNMYHHFGDFLNLYLSMHLNGSFSQRVSFIMWDTSEEEYEDMFKDVYRAFTHRKPMLLRAFAGKKVCFKDAIFSFMAQMVGGHYYHYETKEGCKGSGLYTAFRDFLLHRLAIPITTWKRLTRTSPSRVIITMISRGLGASTRFMKNEIELYTAIRDLEDVEVRIIDYNYKMPLEKQLVNSANSDILIGMHGAGLMHLLFLPDWGVVFEVYTTGFRLFKELAKLRGLNYMTWQDEELMTVHKGNQSFLKESNYTFDVDEFVRLTRKAVDLVREHNAYKAMMDSIVDEHREL